MPRLIYIHGYVEDPSIFDQLAPLLPGEPVLNLSLQEEFARWNPNDQTVNVSTLAGYLTSTYQIGSGDVVIGHSMGGWIAVQLKAQTGCGAVQISSYTNPRKVITAVRHMGVLRWLVRLGVLQSKRLTDYAIKRYPFDESRALHRQLVERLRQLPRRYIYQQLRVLLAPYPTPPAAPDVRIHTRSDTILRFPDEPFDETPGDHFNLVYHPTLVAAPILAWLNKASVTS